MREEEGSGASRAVFGEDRDGARFGKVVAPAAGGLSGKAPRLDLVPREFLVEEPGEVGRKPAERAADRAEQPPEAPVGLRVLVLLEPEGPVGEGV